MTLETEGRPVIRLHFAGEPEAQRAANYGLARFDLCSNREIEELAAFARSVPGSEPPGVDEPSWASEPRKLRVVYEGRGWIGGREVGVAARAVEDRHRLELEDGTVVAVFEREGERVLWVAPGRDPMLSRFGVLGPGLAIALALSGCFSLHAGAVMIGGRALVLMGESGSGKSTMARRATARRGCRRIADDVVPVRVSPRGELRLRPRFPQLKLDHASQWVADEEVACGGLLAIKRRSDIDVCGFQELSKRASVLALLESSVASRLFSRELRQRELDTWIAAAGHNRILDWLVPDDAGRISESFEFLASLPAQLAGPGA